MKIEVEENNPFVTVRVSLDERKPGSTGYVAVDTDFVISHLLERGIKVGNIRKSAIIDNYSKGAPLAGEWEFRNAAFPRKKSKSTPKSSPPAETKAPTSKRRRKNVVKTTEPTTGPTEEN